MKLTKILLTMVVLVLLVGCTQELVEQIEIEEPEEEVLPPTEIVKEYSIDADDNGFYPSQITVNEGDKVAITFNVLVPNTYFGELDFRSDVWGQTEAVQQEDSVTVEFVAEETFEFTANWPRNDVAKATGTVYVK